MQDLIYFVLGKRQKENPSARTIIGPPYQVFAVTNTHGKPPYYQIALEDGRPTLNRLSEEQNAYRKVKKWVCSRDILSSPAVVPAEDIGNLLETSSGFQGKAKLSTKN